MRRGPVWLEAHGLCEFFYRLARLAFVLQRECEVVVRLGVVWVEFEGLAIVADGGIPRLRTRNFDGLFTIGLGCLGEARAGEDENRCHQNHRSTAEVEQQVRPVSSFTSVTAGGRGTWRRCPRGERRRNSGRW